MCALAGGIPSHGGWHPRVLSPHRLRWGFVLLGVLLGSVCIAALAVSVRRSGWCSLFRRQAPRVRSPSPVPASLDLCVCVKSIIALSSSHFAFNVLLIPVQLGIRFYTFTGQTFCGICGQSHGGGINKSLYASNNVHCI